MFNIGFTELLILAVVVLVCVDPRKMPELARVVGRLLGEFKKATGDIKLSKLMGHNIENTIENLVEKKIEKPPSPPVATHSKVSEKPLAEQLPATPSKRDESSSS